MLSKQIEISEFTHPFEVELDHTNRWVKLSKVLPWDDLLSVFDRSLPKNKEYHCIDSRLAVGSIIIKHRLNISDKELVLLLQENIYLQYFVGFQNFQESNSFETFLFVNLQKYIGSQLFDELTQSIIELSEEKESKKNNSIQSDSDENLDKTENIETFPIQANQISEQKKYTLLR